MASSGPSMTRCAASDTGALLMGASTESFLSGRRQGMGQGFCCVNRVRPKPGTRISLAEDK